ncbi:MAG: CBS domain-containing protein [Pirellulales bacterium]
MDQKQPTKETAMALRVKDAMKANIKTVLSTDNLEEVCETMFRSNATCMPVVDQEGYYLGLLTETGILDWLFNQPRLSRVASDCMRPEAPVVFLETRLTELIDLFSHTKTQHASVIDDGRVVSVITIRELIRYTTKIHKRVSKESNKAVSIQTNKNAKQSKQDATPSAIHPQHEMSSPHLSEKTPPAKGKRQSKRQSKSRS